MIPTSFMQPDRLIWLWAVPALLGLYAALVLMRRSSSTSYKSELSKRIGQVLPRNKAWKRYLSVAMSVLSLAALVVAYARPKGEVDEPRDRATIVIVIDVSNSMRAKDVSPSRLAAAQEAAKEFVDMVPTRFNIAFVTFAGTARLRVPPTTDRSMVKSSIDGIQLAPSTAIGEGIVAALDSLALVPADPDKPDEVPPASIVLLSDGATNIGIPSMDAAKQARDMKVPIFTIAYGTLSGYIEDQGRRQPVPVSYDELERVARTSNGKAFKATSKDELSSVYQNISSVIGYQKVEKETTGKFVWISLLCAALASLGVISLASRWP
ncbi:MAG: VWA domain-containing protein [Propionibacteriaceae bacterium]